MDHERKKQAARDRRPCQISSLIRRFKLDNDSSCMPTQYPPRRTYERKTDPEADCIINMIQNTYGSLVRPPNQLPLPLSYADSEIIGYSVCKTFFGTHTVRSAIK